MRETLGAPSTEQVHEGGRVVFAYEPALDLAFGEPLGLVSITVYPSAGDVRLWDEPLFGIEPEELVKRFEQWGMAIGRSAPNGWGDWSCTLPSAGVIVYFAVEEGLEAVEMYAGRWERGEGVGEALLPRR